MTNRPIIFSGPMVRALLAGRKTMTRRLSTNPLRKCEVGDRLWVRESWAQHPNFVAGVPCAALYRADRGMTTADWKWRPSIHMPRWASRITLEVTAVKVERLQDITEEDAKAEGIERHPHSGGMCFYDYTPTTDCLTPVDSFATLWGKIHGNGAWAANPEVVAISFRVMK